MAAISLGGKSSNDYQKEKDFEALQSWVKKLHGRLTDERQNNGSPDLTEDGKRWRYSFMPKGVMSMEVEEIQTLFRLFDLPELEAIESLGDCQDCLHGHGVSSATGLWPFIEDCDGCYSPTHPNFIPYADLGLYHYIIAKNVFNIPVGGTISIYFERLKFKTEGRAPNGEHWKYADTGGNCVRVEDQKRICKMTSLGQLDIPGHERHHR